ncbi:MAG: polysaccharide deacetylase family protein [Proteobacteria bacterium]|nr:polysaccharide deacetylase family protein [Pseudomonadota bacterium]
MRPPVARRRRAAAASALASAFCAAWLLAACSSAPPAPAAAPPPPPRPPAAEAAAAPERMAAAGGPWLQAQGQVLGRNERLLVYRPAAGDSFEGIAERFLGSAAQAWQVADANDDDGDGSRSPAPPSPAVPLLVPLRPLNPLGVGAERLQTVPILCYHRLGPGNAKMVVSPAAFEAQMAWLVRNGYRVVRLADLAGFLAGRKALPARSVVISFDDGYESVYRHAYPVLKKYRLPATVFVYTDFLGGGDALTWAQLQEMQASGLVDVQSHSKSHRNLIERRAGETDERYRAALDTEMRAPRELLERRLPPLKVRQLAYPFGDANEAVLEAAARNGYELGATVVPGGNAFYAQPLMLRRTMIFGDTSLEAFKSKLQTSRALAAP